jgi:hypothetical protein
LLYDFSQWKQQEALASSPILDQLILDQSSINSSFDQPGLLDQVPGVPASQTALVKLLNRGKHETKSS